MADYDRHPEDRGYRGRDRNRDYPRDRDFQRDARLDDRTSATPGTAGGYRARFQDEERPAYWSRDYLRNEEGRSFADDRPDYETGDYSSDYSRRARGDRDQSYRSLGGGYESRPFNPYRGGRGGNANIYSNAPQGYDEVYGGSQRYDARDFDRPAESYRGSAFGPDYGPQRPNDRYARSGRGQDDRTWFDRAADRVSSWFGDEDARRRGEMDARDDHRGRGPKGYKRSDERIKEDVSDRLTDDSWLDASNIEVQVNSCDVTLTGHVATKDDKRRAEHLAESVSGVDNVQNNLRVDARIERGMATHINASAYDSGNGVNKTTPKV